jgi:O-antigen/teichoic acid export membrane protein
VVLKRITSSRLGKSLLSVYCATAANGALGFLAVPIGLRCLGAEGYGLFSLYTLMVSYVLLADLGISKNLLALLSRHRQPQDQIEYLRTALSLYCCLCLGWLLLLPVLLWLVPSIVFPVAPAYRTILRWLTVLAIGEFVVGVPQSMLQTACVAREQFGRYSKYTVLSGLLRNSVLIGGFLAFHSVRALAAAMAARKVIDFCLAYRVMGTVPGLVWRPRFSVRPALAMLAQSGTLSVAQVLYSSLMGAGSYLVNAFFGLHWLGLYRVAFDLAGKVSVIANGVAVVLFPKLAHAFTSPARQKAIGAVVPQALETSWTFYSVLGACGVIGAPWVLPKIGIDQPETLTLFVLLAVGLSINCHTLVTNEIIQASGRYRKNILVSSSGLMLVVAVFLAFAGAIGPAAIGVAWIVATTGSGLIADWIVLNSLGVLPTAQFISGAKKLLILILCILTVASHFGLVFRQLSVLAVGVLVILLVRDGWRLFLTAQKHRPGVLAPLVTEQVLTA